MDNPEFRLECLRLASQEAAGNPESILALAQRYYAFVTGAKDY